MRKENFKLAKENYLIACEIRKKNNDNDGLAKININLGSIYGSQQDYIHATKSYLEAIKYFDSKRNDTISSLTKANLALIFQKTKNYPKAIKYLDEAIAFEIKNKMTNGLCNAYITLGNIYVETNDTVKGVKFYNKSLENCKLCDDKLGISTVYQLLGNLTLDQKKINESNIYFKKSNDILKVLNSESEIESSKLYTTQELINN